LHDIEKQILRFAQDKLREVLRMTILKSNDEGVVEDRVGRSDE
jgi:hypothetical protein